MRGKKRVKAVNGKMPADSRKVPRAEPGKRNMPLDGKNRLGRQKGVLPEQIKRGVSRGGGVEGCGKKQFSSVFRGRCGVFPAGGVKDSVAETKRGKGCRRGIFLGRSKGKNGHDHFCLNRE